MNKLLILSAFITLNAFASGASLPKARTCVQTMQDFLGTPIDQDYVNFAGVGSAQFGQAGERKCEVAVRHTHFADASGEGFDILLNTEIDLQNKPTMAANVWLSFVARTDSGQHFTECTATATDLVVKTHVTRASYPFQRPYDTALHVAKDANGNLIVADFSKNEDGSNTSGYCKDLVR